MPEERGGVRGEREIGGRKKRRNKTGVRVAGGWLAHCPHDENPSFLTFLREREQQVCDEARVAPLLCTLWFVPSSRGTC
uniref:Uncharacterized protein n=1 Tax=Oryza nivara TaxID=4536 RepID=A0A0E0IS81_ORYNI